MIKIHKSIVKKALISGLSLTFALTVCLPNVYAQKSSGTLDNDEIKSYTQNVESIDDAVTKSASTAGDAVRFLLRPIREADISPNMTGTVSKIHYDVGQRFKKGATLISMKCSSVEAQVAAQRARVQKVMR